MSGVHEKTTFYPEGGEFTSPSGAVFRRINGHWVRIRPAKEKTQ